MSYTPTPNQVEALARDDYAHWNEGHLEQFEFDKGAWIPDAQAVVNYPAFQSIIHAAQSEAWARGYGDGHADFCTTDADAGCGANARFTNPYRTDITA